MQYSLLLILESLNCTALKWIGGNHVLLLGLSFFLVLVYSRKIFICFRSLQRLKSCTDQSLLMFYLCFPMTTCFEHFILLRLVKKHRTSIVLCLQCLFMWMKMLFCDTRALTYISDHLFKQKAIKLATSWQKGFKRTFLLFFFSFPSQISTFCIDFSWR